MAAKCICATPQLVAPNPPQILCNRCGGLVSGDSQEECQMDTWTTNVNEEARQRFEAEVEAMTNQKAIEILHLVSATLAEAEYIAASIKLDHIAAWLEHRQAEVQG
jgi:hypothetical protein